MGIGGHMLGERKLRRLREVSGLPLDRAYRRGQECEGRTANAAECFHWRIDWDSGESIQIINPTHWASCPKEEK